MVESARGAKRIVALDGCQVACAKKTIEHAGITVTDWICVTEHGISTMRSQMYPLSYCQHENDIIVYENFFCHVPNLLLDFQEAELSQSLIDHYAELQSNEHR